MREVIQNFVRERRWVHTSLGLFGNASFFVGSILFLSENLQPAGVWLFIFGSLGMLVDSIGSTIIKFTGKE